VFLVGGRDACRSGEAFGGLGVGELAGALNALLDVADGGEVFVQLALIAAAQLAVEVAEVLLDQVEDALALGIPFGALLC